MEQQTYSSIKNYFLGIASFLFYFISPLISEAIENQSTEVKAKQNASVLLTQSLDRAKQLAHKTTIYRDTYGVPHVTGPTDASVVFGFTYARAEDEFQKIQKSLLSGMGRSAELIGPGGFPIDRLMRINEVPKHAKAEFAATDDEFKTILIAYADALNYYVANHPEEQPVLIRRFEPWHLLAASRTMNLALLTKSPEYRHLLKVMKQQADSKKNKTKLPEPKPKEEQDGSNMWAIGPNRSATGNAMLLINPHIPLNEVYEGHLNSETGLNISGGFAYGSFLFPFAGHNEKLGWSLTVNYPDIVDVYVESFNHPQNPLKYRFNDQWLTAETWKETIKIKQTNGTLIEQEITCLKTHHGPVLILSDKKGYAIRTAMIREGGMPQQFYQMAKAKNRNEFQAAVSKRALVFHNIMYADVEGNTWYVYNSATPRRDPTIDWTKPVPGNTSATEWAGYHALHELPQVLNPPCGWMQNCNSSPFTTCTMKESPQRKKYPRYLGHRDQDNNRVKISKKILSGNDKFTFDTWSDAAWDTHVNEATTWILGMSKALSSIESETTNQRHSQLAKSVKPLVDELKSWDQQCKQDSVASTLFHLWYEKMGRRIQRTKPNDIATLEVFNGVKQDLENKFGDWRIEYGEVFRHQRPDRAGQLAGDTGKSFPLAGGHPRVGMVFTHLSREIPGSKKRYGFHGHSYVSVIEFDPDGIRSRSIVPFGQSTNPKSPHYLDQAPLYANGQFKPAWFTMDEVRKNTSGSYHPGE
ncbi:penicillin acylase family protein [Gimesia aquarii]|uniref:Glutaryl-7-aminocephalosporanic-acid acylase n=1 Tax=Gimesia aquarii TaxID=2527964 RepID=A0A517VZ10_9PLAN|nr:penicillin acylase family protein [Gimesia aquarii]QDT98233.1 Glutaryl-7-aminocephalosporanic-acid acylase precursor [Gimesia aquarii]